MAHIGALIDPSILERMVAAVTADAPESVATERLPLPPMRSRASVSIATPLRVADVAGHRLVVSRVTGQAFCGRCGLYVLSVADENRPCSISH